MIKVLLASEYVTGAGGQGRVDVLNEKDHASHLSLAPELVGTFPEEDYGVGGRRCHDTCGCTAQPPCAGRAGDTTNRRWPSRVWSLRRHISVI